MGTPAKSAALKATAKHKGIALLRFVREVKMSGTRSSSNTGSSHLLVTQLPGSRLVVDDIIVYPTFTPQQVDMIYFTYRGFRCGIELGCVRVFIRLDQQKGA